MNARNRELPPCFKPNEACTTTLQRVKNGLAIEWYEARPLVELSFINEGNLDGTGYTLTERGEEALRRA